MSHPIYRGISPTKQSAQEVTISVLDRQGETPQNWTLQMSRKWKLTFQHFNIKRYEKIMRNVQVAPVIP